MSIRYLMQIVCLYSESQSQHYAEVGLIVYGCWTEYRIEGNVSEIFLFVISDDSREDPKNGIACLQIIKSYIWYVQFRMQANMSSISI